MRIVLLTSTAGWGGSATSYAKLMHGLRERGHLVHLLAAASGRAAGFRETWALVRLLRRLDAQVVVADTPRDVRLAAQATLLHPACIVYRYNVGAGRRDTSPLGWFSMRRLAACVYQSDYIRQEAVAHASSLAHIPSFTIPNGYDTARFAPTSEGGAAFRARYGIAPTSAVVLTSARLTRDKGHRVAIAALAQVRRGGADLVYLVCGDGDREDELRELALAHGLPAIFTGYLGRDDMTAALNAADVVVHPSLHEIFPNAVGEAMACARPVVATDAGGTGELLGRDGSAGMLVPPQDAAALAGVVLALLRDPERRARIGAAARCRVESEFPLSRMIDGYQAALAAVAGMRLPDGASSA